MKKLYIVLILLPLFTFSQTTQQKKAIANVTNKRALKSISRKSKTLFIENKEKAVNLAKKNNWDLTVKNDSSFSELVGVSKNNRPIYYTTYNYGAAVTSRANKLHTGGTLGLNINGENMISGVWDAGSAMPSHELFTNRVAVLDNTQNSHYHATHVAGTIIGTDLVQNGNAKGMAYKGNLNSYDWNNDISEVAVAAENGLLLSNHSYGLNPYYVEEASWGKYSVASQSFDEIMFNAPYYQFVCAAGNSRGAYNTSKNGYDLLTGHSLCKNGITVAAVQEVQNYTGPQSVVMSDFSSWGPTDDGRIKPDISAKGVDTFSAFDTSSNSYSTISGTSMASPSVTGTLMLYQQYYNQLNGKFMKASTLKGLMIHTADEAGQNEGPDYSFGWGLINAEKAANLITKNGIESYILEKTLNQNNSFSIAVNAKGTEPLLATLSWTDPKGNLPDDITDSSNPSLVNDLDIRITRDADTTYPWKLNVANPSAGATKGDNTVDNLEKVTLNDPNGSYTITVSHKGSLVNSLQNYSLIISGVNVKDFWIQTNEKTKSVCKGVNTVDYTFNLQTKSNFNDIVTFSAIDLPPGISANFSSLTLSATGDFTMSLNNLSSLNQGSYSFTVKASTATDFFEMPVTIIILSSTLQPSVLLMPENNATSVSPSASFEWQADVNAQDYEIQIASDVNFNTIIETATVNKNSFTSNLLTNNSVYFWRVKPKNICGLGDFSTINSFTTACSTPTNVLLVSSTTTTATIGWLDTSATSWEVEIVPLGTNPTGLGITTNSNPYIASGLTSNTWYDFYVRSKCNTGVSNWTLKTSFNTSPDYCVGDHFYDTGGQDGNYKNGEYKTTVISPSISGERVKVTFNSFNLESCCDSMQIYNGPSTDSVLLYSGGSLSIPSIFESTHASGSLTFVFISDNSVTGSGWDATVICEPLPPCANKPTNVYNNSISKTTAQFYWTENSNASSWEVEIVPQGTNPTGVGIITNSNPYNATGLTSNTWYDFYVRSKCGNVNSDWSLRNSFKTLLIDYCGGDHFYDTGGPDNNYPSYDYKITTINPSTIGDRIKAVFNSFQLSQYDRFEVYDGTSTSSTLLFSYNGNNTPETLTATNINGALTFYFYSYQTTAPGWDATIICEPLPPCSSKPSNIYNNNITKTTAQFYWTENSNATSWEVEIVPQGSTPTGVGITANSNPYTATGLTSNTWYDFYVRSKCGNVNSDWSLKNSFNTLADYCAGDHFYDTGGPNNNYLSNNYNTTTISPSTNGDRIKAIFNSFQLSQYDNFEVYDGPDSSYPLIFSYNGTNIPETLTATNINGALTFRFYSYQTITSPGWDATIICEPIPPCSIKPSNIIATNLGMNSATINWIENSYATSWEVEIVPQGSTPTGVGIITNSNPYTAIGLTSNTWYDFYIRSKCGNVNSDWSVKNSFNTLGDYCAGDHFYDTGGPNGNYKDRENITTVINPTNSGERVKIVFNSFNTESCCDYIEIYNGPISSSNLLYSGRGNTIPPSFESTHSSGSLTFIFRSDGSVVQSGWDATIICEPMPACASKPTNIITTNLGANSATINWTENSNATSWEVEVIPQNSIREGRGTIYNTNYSNLSGLLKNTCYDFYVRSICNGGTSNWSSVYNFCTQPDYCAGDRFYDSGNATQNYKNSENKLTVIYPQTPSNKVKVTFNSFNLESCCDYLRIYDGPDTSSPLLSSNSGANIPGTVTSSHPSGALAFLFFSDSSVTYEGWDATVECGGSLSTTKYNENSNNFVEYSPNPVVSLLKVKAEKNIKKYEIYNGILGLMMEKEINKNEFDINFENFSHGLYYAKLIDDEGKTKFFKIIKK